MFPSKNATHSGTIPDLGPLVPLHLGSAQAGQKRWPTATPKHPFSFNASGS